MNKRFKHIILTFCLFIFSVFNCFAQHFTVAYTYVAGKNEQIFLSGLKSVSHDVIFKTFTSCKNPDIIIAFGETGYLSAENSDKPIVVTFIPLKSKNITTKNVAGYFYTNFDIVKIADILKKKVPELNTIALVLHDENYIKYVVQQKIYQPLVQILEVRDTNKIFYKFREAMESSDMVLLMPDDFVLNYFSFRKVLKMLYEKEKPFVGFNKKLTNYGAKLVLIPDYYKEGVKAGKFLRNLFKNKMKFQREEFFITNFNVLK